MAVWRAISGRYHLVASCTHGPGQAAIGHRIRKTWLTKRKMWWAHHEGLLCHCLQAKGQPLWRPDLPGWRGAVRRSR